MSTFDYLTVLLSIVIGLGISRVLSCFGELVPRRASVRFYWVPLTTATVVFLAHVEFWWSAFGFREIPEWNFFSFVLLLAVTICLYLLSVLVLPDPTGEESVDLKQHYYRNHRWFYSVVLIYLLLDVAFDLAVSGEPLVHPVRPFQVVFLVLLSTAAVTRNERVHQFVAASALILFLSQITWVGLQID